MSIAEKLTQIAENEQKVYNAGYEKGKSEGGDTDAAYEQGVTDGKQAENLAFWNSITANGTRTDYSYYFRQKAWNKDTFKPPYALKPNKAREMFFESGAIDYEYIKTVDFSNCINFMNCFYNSSIKKLGVVDCSKSVVGHNPLNATFYAATLEEIDLFMTPNDGTIPYNDTFTNCSKLKEIRISGIFCRSVSFANSPLSKASFISISEHCTLDSPITLTVRTSAVNKAFETSEGALDGMESEEWLNLWKPMGNITIQYYG